MLSRYLGVALALFVFPLVQVSAAKAQGSPAVGIVISARSGQVGAAAASPGQTVFSGDRVITAKDSGLIIQAGKFQFSFHDNTVAVLIARPDGILLEIESGAATFSALNPDPGLSVFVSDLRIRSMDLQAFSGSVAVDDPCSVVITSYVGRLEVLRKKQTEELRQRSVLATPEFPIEPLPRGATPGDRALHQGHTHGACKLPVTTAGGLQKWVVPTVVAGAATVAVVAWRLSVSPN